MCEIVYYCRDDVYWSRHGRYLLTVYHPQPTVYLLVIGVSLHHSAEILSSEYKLFREQTKRFCHKKYKFLITFCNSYINLNKVVILQRLMRHKLVLVDCNMQATAMWFDYRNGKFVFKFTFTVQFFRDFSVLKRSFSALLLLHIR